MAKIVDNPQGGRRLIRLSSDDIMMIVAMVQQTFRDKMATYDTLEDHLHTQPFYLPEEMG